jgi:hypothetical protein
MIVTCLFARGPLNILDEQLHMAFAIIILYYIRKTLCGAVLAG